MQKFNSLLFQAGKNFNPFKSLNSVQQSNKIVYNFSNEQMKSFTEVFDKKVADDQQKKVSQGRAWRADELRIKSNEDLHKLWYVLLKEKNLLLSDNALKQKMHGSQGPQGRMSKLKVSMARLLTVVNERKKVRTEYRRQLEDEYVQKQRKLYEEQLAIQQQNSVQVPEINQRLLVEKYKDLKKGQDNTRYLQREINHQNKKEAERQYLREKYDYKNKQIVEQDDPQANDPSVITKFSSFFDEQMRQGKSKVSEEEVLRAHVKNWKMLNLKQRRIIINFLQARRARDAKKEFLKELDLLAQKIAHDEMQTRQQQA